MYIETVEELVSYQESAIETVEELVSYQESAIETVEEVTAIETVEELVLPEVQITYTLVSDFKSYIRHVKNTLETRKACPLTCNFSIVCVAGTRN